MNAKLRDRLVQAASQEEAFVHYDEVADILRLTGERLDHSAAMSRELDAISTFEYEHDRPLLTAVVVHKDDLRPGSGFFTMAKRNGKQKPLEDDDAFFIQELARVRECWRPRKDTGKSEQVSPDVGAGSAREYRVIMEQEATPNCSPGKWCTDKFHIGDNARLELWFKRRRTRLLPLWPRSAKVKITLRCSDTGKVAKEAMRKGEGVVKVCGDSGIFGGREVSTYVIIQEGGVYYLEVEWGSLIKWWKVRVVEPMA